MSFVLWWLSAELVLCTLSREWPLRSSGVDLDTAARVLFSGVGFLGHDSGSKFHDKPDRWVSPANRNQTAENVRKSSGLTNCLFCSIVGQVLAGKIVQNFIELLRTEDNSQEE